MKQIHKKSEKDNEIIKKNWSLDSPPFEADVITYMRYGSFAASMTGNMVFAGREIALLQWEDNKKWQNRRFSRRKYLKRVCFYTNKYINIALLFNLDSVQSEE